MQDLFKLEAELRSDKGKGASRRLRREAGLVPAIVYGGKEEPQMLSLNHNEVIRHLEHEAFYSHILTLVIEGKEQSVILKDMQRHPFKPKIQHMDFQRVSAKSSITMQVPLHFLNENKAPGVKDGGQISHQMTEVEIECQAQNLPEFIEVDLGNMELNDIVHLSDLTLPKGVQIPALNQGEDAAVATLHRRGGGEEAEGEGDEAEATEE